MTVIVEINRRPNMVVEVSDGRTVTVVETSVPSRGGQHNALTDRDAAGSHPATAVSFAPDGDLVSTNVQAVVLELRNDTDTKLAGKASTGAVAAAQADATQALADAASAQADATQALSDAATATSAASAAQADVDAHVALANNPHAVTAAQVRALPTFRGLRGFGAGNHLNTVGGAIPGNASGFEIVVAAILDRAYDGSGVTRYLLSTHQQFAGPGFSLAVNGTRAFHEITDGGGSLLGQFANGAWADETGAKVLVLLTMGIDSGSRFMTVNGVDTWRTAMTGFTPGARGLRIGAEAASGVLPATDATIVGVAYKHDGALTSAQRLAVMRDLMLTGELPTSVFTNLWSFRDLATGACPATVEDEIGSADLTLTGSLTVLDDYALGRASTGVSIADSRLFDQRVPSTTLGATSPLAISNDGALSASPTLSIQAATALQNGYMSSAYAALLEQINASDLPGRIIRTGNDTYTFIRDNYTATTDPINTSDSSENYTRGSLWHNVTKKRVWLCMRADVGKADWKLYAWDGLNLLEGGFFGRSSEGSTILGDLGDGTDPSIFWTSSNIRRIEQRNDGRGPTLLVERQRINQMLRSEEFDNAAWTKTGGTTVTANQVQAPDAAYREADRINFGASATDELSQTFTSADGEHAACTIYLRADAPQTVRLVVLKRDGTETSVTCNVTTTWQRFENTVLLGTGATTARFILRNHSDAQARSVYAWNAQVERDQGGKATFPTSAIRATSSVFTRQPDLLHYNSGEYPLSFAYDGFELDVCMLMSRAELTSSTQGVTLVSFQGLVGISRVMITFNFGSPNAQIWIAAPVVHPTFVVATGNIDWGREQWLTIGISPKNGQIIVSGATSGDGTYNVTPWRWGGEIMYLSSEGSQVNAMRYGCTIRRL